MKLTIMGAAGVRTPLIIDEIIHRQDRLGITELALMDINADRLALIRGVASGGETYQKINFLLSTTTNAKQALDGADYVITTFRVGDMESRVIDELVPLELGVLGQETTGPGGFAMGLRTIPVLAGYAGMMKQVCPGAWLINFANPSGMMTEALVNHLGYGKAIGICDGPSSMLQVMSAALRIPAERLEANYFGLNHLGWFKSIPVDGVDRQPDLIRMLMEHPEQSLLDVDPQVIGALQMIPNEYLYYYYHSRQAVANILKAGITRGQAVLQMNNALFRLLNDAYRSNDLALMRKLHSEYLQNRSDSYMKNEAGHASNELKDAMAGSQIGYAELALDLIEGLSGGKTSRLIVNVKNQDSIKGMDYSDIVEIPAFVSRNDIKPVEIGQVPDHCLGLMKQIKAYETLTIQAVLENSYSKAVAALTIHPLVQDYNLAVRILDGYLTRHGNYFPHLG